MTAESCVRWQGKDLVLHIHVQPKASKDEFMGLHGTALKVRITAPPVDGKANAQLITFLSKQFNVSKSQVELISGDTSREKRFLIKEPKKIPDEIKNLLSD